MDSPKTRLAISLLGCMAMAYVAALLPQAFYEPVHSPRMPGVIWFLHLIFLFIHEGGHAIFRPFGDTIYFLGGSIMQVLAPAAWIAAALHERSKLAAPALFFTGYSLVDVSVYIKDAEMRVLPLIGGHKTRHDWWTVLSKYDALDLGRPLGETVFWLGMTMAVCGIVWAVYLSAAAYREAARN
jgi:hypothetical protein